MRFITLDRMTVHLLLFTVFLVKFSWAEDHDNCNRNICEVEDKLYDDLTNKILALSSKIEKIETQTIQSWENVYEKLLEIAKPIRTKTEILDRRISEIPTTIIKTLEPYDCSDIKTSGEQKSGVYSIYPQGEKVTVYCNMDIDGGGWTVFLMRLNQTIRQNFNQPWKKYRDGFGSPPYEYWMGNEILHKMTNQRDYSMRVDIVGPRRPSEVWSEFSNFKLAPENFKYQLSISGLLPESTMYNDPGFLYNDQQYFYTNDRENYDTGGSCAWPWGGFWYYGHDRTCGFHFPTASHEKMRFQFWSKLDNYGRTIPTEIEMKIRPKPYDCSDIQKLSKRSSGVYSIYPQGKKVVVYCNMDTDGGGWTVFLKRQKQSNNQENFKRNWKSSKNGFGMAPNEYWLGNELLHQMTNRRQYAMRADIDGPGTPSEVWSEFSNFKVAPESLQYQLSISGLNTESTMHNGPGFLINDQQYFSSIDRDNDNDSGNCAEAFGSFWHNDCGVHFPTNSYEELQFNYWSKIDEEQRLATEVEMKIRPRNWFN